MSALSERIAQAALHHFRKLPSKCKPRFHPDGRREWTPLSAIVAVNGENVECLSLGTGTKCLPETALPRSQGAVLHDCHAEVVALRGFNRWVLNELEYVLLDPQYQSICIQRSPIPAHTDLSLCGYHRRYVFKDDASFYFFTTEAPCGDASMELLIRSKSSEDALPWLSVSPTPKEHAAPLLLGRGYFSQLGVVRRKPARGDAEATRSKSCTDKLALKQFTGLLSFPADTLIARTPNSFIKSLVTYQDQYDQAGYERAFGPKGRLQPLANEARFFTVSALPSSSTRFAFEKNSKDAPLRASNVSALWIRGSGSSSNDTIEVLLNGVKQGFKQFEERPGKESAICRKQMWSLSVRIESLLASTHQNNSTAPRSDEQPPRTYRGAKDYVARQDKRQLKASVTQTLTGWVPNTGDEDWSPS